MTQPLTILSRFEEIRSRFPDSIAVEGSTRRLTYWQLNAAANSLAAELLEAGIRTGAYVPLLMTRSPEYIVGVLAILKCGAVYAPIDPESPEARRETMLRPLNASAGIVGNNFKLPDRYREFSPASALDRALAAGHTTPEPPLATRVDPEAPAYVMYTSGSTGAPKGVVVPHRAVVRLVVDADFAEMDSGMRWSVMSAVAFDASTLEIWAALLNGGTCVIQEMPFPDLDDLAKFIADSHIHCTWLTAALFNALVDRDCRSLGTLQQLFTGGERESPVHIHRFCRSCPNVRLIHGYGPTENTTFSLCHTLREADLVTDRIPIGTPIRGSTAKITPPGAHSEEEVTNGELLVGGVGLALGYLGNDELTRERFVTDRSGTRWYRTGDLVTRLPDGNILYQGRIDRQVKIRGHRIEPEDIESTLSRCPGIRQAAVLVTGDDYSDRRLIAFYSPTDATSDSAVREYLSDHLPRTMIPEVLHGLPELPRSTTGKIDRKALGHIATNRTPHHPDATEPTSRIEQGLIQLIQQRLPMATRVDLAANFCRIGGHSLTAMRLSSDIHDAFGTRVSPVEILTLPSIRVIAEQIEKRLAGQSEPEPSRDASEARIGIVRALLTIENERDSTGQSMLVHQGWSIRPGLSSERVKQLWHTILGRHSALRTKIEIGSKGITSSEANLESQNWFIDEGSLHKPDQVLGDKTPSIVLDRIGAPLPNGRMPARVHYWSLPNDRALVVAAYQHAAVDEWSLNILQDEFCRLLNGESLKESEPYDRYTHYENLWIDTSSAHRIAELVLRSHSDGNELPEPRSRAICTREFSPAACELIVQQLDVSSMRTGASPAAVALAAFGQVLGQRYGAPGYLILTPVSKRLRPKLQRVVGCCLDMRLIDARPDHGSGIVSVHNQIRDAQTESIFPLEELVNRVRDVNPAAVAHITRFGFTYRDIDRSISGCGDHELKPLLLPQLAARFGIALHIERGGQNARAWFEAARDTVTGAELDQLTSAFEAAILGTSHRPRIETVAGQTDASRPEERRGSGSASELPTRTVSSRTIEVLRELWRNEVGRTPSDDDDFLAQGGSSLKAMKLGAAIHDRTGLKLHVGKFLITPTFANLAHWVRNDPERPYSNFRVPDRTKGTTILAFPGSSGRAIDLHAFWSAYSRCDAEAARMIGFDLVTMAEALNQRSASNEVMHAFIDRAAEIAASEHRGQTIEIIGYSLGGLIALGVADQLSKRHIGVSRVLLLDAYAPPYMVRSPQLIMAKLNAQIRSGQLWNTIKSKTFSRSNDTLRREPLDSAGELLKRRDLWRGIHLAFQSWQVPVVHAPVQLIRSAPLARQLRPLHYRTTNGLRTCGSSPIQVTEVDVEHLAMLTSGAQTVAAAAAKLRVESRRP